jgi:uncharacterized membrane protein YdbT with pleckstrin-like domain
MTPDYDASPAMFRNHPLAFAGAVILIAAFGLGILVLLYWYIKTRSVRLTITGDLIHLSLGIFSKAQTDIAIEDIRSVSVRQSFWQRIFRVGLIEIYTTGDKPEFSLDGMPDPNFIRDYIRNRSMGDGQVAG